MDNTLLKEKVYKQCIAILLDRITELKSALDSITASGNNETKSSAGDKYEIARSMMHIEQENLARQISELSDQREELQKINLAIKSKNIVKGSLIFTDKANFFLSSGIGKIQIENIIFYAISTQSPLGIKFMGAKKGDQIKMNTVSYTIKEVQ